MRKYLSIPLILVELLAVAACPANASGISVSARIEPEVIAVGDQATLVVTVQGKFRKSTKPLLPELEDFYIYESGSSSSFNFINGAVSSSLSFTYIIVPRKEGRFTIAPIKFIVKDKEYEANPVAIEAVAPTQLKEPPTRRAEPDEIRSAPRGKHIFIAASVDKDTIYVNEQLTWTLYFYVDPRAQIIQSPSFTPPEAEGFWVEDLPPQQKYTKDIQGRRYVVNEVKRGYFPTSPGEYTIGPAQVTAAIDDFGLSTRDDFFSRPFRSLGFGKPVSLSTEEKRIVVLPLPERGRPADFSGVVGRNLELSMRADKQVLQVGEPVNVVVEVRGQGNIKTITAPELPELPAFKVYQSGSSSNVLKNNYIIAGKKKYEYVLVPKVQGRKSLPPLKLSYFDPAERVYKRTSSSPLHLDVKPGAKEETREIIFAGGGSDIEVLGRDINFIHPVPSVIKIGGRRLYESKLYTSLHVLPALAVVFAAVVERRRRRWRENEPLGRAERAARKAEKRLNSARRLLQRGKVEEALVAVAGAVTGFFADKMNASAAGLTFAEIEAYLRSNGVPAAEAGEFRLVLTACDVARYARTSVGVYQATEILERSSKLIKAIAKRYL